MALVVAVIRREVDHPTISPPMQLRRPHLAAVWAGSGRLPDHPAGIVADRPPIGRVAECDPVPACLDVVTGFAIHDHPRVGGGGCEEMDRLRLAETDGTHREAGEEKDGTMHAAF